MTNARDAIHHSAGTREFLTFRLGGEIFAAEASRVMEVMKNADITRVPRMPAHLPGLINVRGNVIAVLDMAMFFGIQAATDYAKSWFVIMEAAAGGERMHIGIPADAVHDVIRLDAAELEPPPDIGINIEAEYILSVAKQNKAYLLIIDVEKTLNAVNDKISSERSA